MSPTKSKVVARVDSDMSLRGLRAERSRTKQSIKSKSTKKSTKPAASAKLAKTAQIANLPELIALLDDRKSFYLTLAGLFLKPLTQEQIDEMAQANYLDNKIGDELIDAGFNDIGRYLRKMNTGSRAELATDWTSSLGGAESYKGEYAVPQASVFLSEEGLMYREQRNEAMQIYFNHQLAAKREVNLPEDHLSLELEFVAKLSESIKGALTKGDIPAALADIDLSKEFITKNILNWFDKLSELALQLIQTRFYRGVFSLTKGYLQLDLTTLDDLKAELD